jgi:hypothetical protein
MAEMGAGEPSSPGKVTWDSGHPAMNASRPETNKGRGQRSWSAVMIEVLPELLGPFRTISGAGIP